MKVERCKIQFSPNEIKANYLFRIHMYLMDSKLLLSESDKLHFFLKLINVDVCQTLTTMSATRVSFTLDRTSESVASWSFLIVIQLSRMIKNEYWGALYATTQRQCMRKLNICFANVDPSLSQSPPAKVVVHTIVVIPSLEFNSER